MEPIKEKPPPSGRQKKGSYVLVFPVKNATHFQVFAILAGGGINRIGVNAFPGIAASYVPAATPEIVGIQQIPHEAPKSRTKPVEFILKILYINSYEFLGFY